MVVFDTVTFHVFVAPTVSLLFRGSPRNNIVVVFYGFAESAFHGVVGVVVFVWGFWNAACFVFNTKSVNYIGKVVYLRTLRKFRDRPLDSVSGDAVARSQDVFRRED